MGNTISPQLLMQALGTDPNKLDPSIIKTYLDHIASQPDLSQPNSILPSVVPTQPITPQNSAPNLTQPSSIISPIQAQPQPLPQTKPIDQGVDPSLATINPPVQDTQSRLKTLLNNPPLQGDPSTQPSTMRRIGGGLIGFGLGLRDPALGVSEGKKFVNAPYDQAYQNWLKQTGALKQQTAEEASQASGDIAQQRADISEKLADTKQQGVQNQLDIANSKIEEYEKNFESRDTTKEAIAKMNEQQKADAEKNNADLKRSMQENAEQTRIQLETMVQSGLNTRDDKKANDLMDRLDKVLGERKSESAPKVAKTKQEIQDTAEQDSLREMAQDSEI